MIYIGLAFFICGILTSFLSFLEAYISFKQPSYLLLSLIAAITGINWLVVIYLVIISMRLDFMAVFSFGIFISSVFCHKTKEKMNSQYV